jgi:NAD(P)H-hydrate epimerase
MRTLTRNQIQAVEHRAIEHYGVPEIVLMENAGRSAAELLDGLGVSGTVVLCCGRGNNGGDGLVIARHLDNRGLPVRVIQFGEPTTPATLTNYQIVSRSGLPLVVFDLSASPRDRLPPLLGDADWIVDALFGTGLRGALRPPFDDVVSIISSSDSGHGDRPRARVFSVDVPSGMDCDSGKPMGACIRADHTATFVATKSGFTATGAAEWLGQVHVLDIGAPRNCLLEVNG